MFKNTLLISALMALVSAETEIASTCVEEQAHLFGANGETDLPFTDYNYLKHSEEFNTIYRMTRLTLCGNEAGDLVGMRAHITRFDAETYEIKSRISMNKIGTNKDVGVSCNSVILDAENGEYLTGMYFAWENPGQIDYIRATTNNNQQISKGTLTSSMETGEMTSVHADRILAFHGYENDRIAAIGQVSVDLDCIKGVTTVETIEEPMLVDVEGSGGLVESHHEATPTPSWIYILIGVVVGVLLMVIVTVIAVMYKQKKGCFKNAAGANTARMPIRVGGNQISNDLEFAGQSIDQKRKSIKAMSQMVRANESADADDLKKPHKKMNEMIMAPDGTQLQSMASVNQVTDADEEVAKKRTS